MSAGTATSRPHHAPSFLAALGEDTEELLSRVRPTVVQIQARDRVVGTGVVGRADGLILTACHVVAPRDQSPIEVEVVATDGRRVGAQVVSADPRLDVAILETGAGRWPVASFGESLRLRVGELIFAVGHPWGQPWTVSVGVVSGVGAFRFPGRSSRASGLWSDVRLAPGNSGGPLFNVAGEVVGLCTMIVGGDLAVAIPSDVVQGWFARTAVRGHRDRDTVTAERESQAGGSGCER